MHRVVGLFLALVSVIAVAGCATPSGAHAPSSERGTDRPAAVPDGVVGTGTLKSWNGMTSGNLQIVATSGHFTLVITGFSTDFGGQKTFGLADSAVRMQQCGENNLWQIGLTPPDNIVRPSMKLPLPNVADGFADPTFFETFLILQYPDGSITRGCQQPIIALTKIAWTMKSIYPAIKVRDGGARVGARGSVKTVGGSPFTYVTAREDIWKDVARRFGITAAELLYLNPIRHPEGDPAIAYAGQILNLSPSNRGNSETRRPGAQ